MALKTELFVFALIAIVNSGDCLKCYVCAGSPSSDCGKAKTSSMVVRDCHAPRQPIFHMGILEDTGNFQVVCLTATLTNFDPKLFERTCGIFPSDVDPCEYLKKKIHVSDCKSCTTDKCNVK